MCRTIDKSRYFVKYESRRILLPIGQGLATVSSIYVYIYTSIVTYMYMCKHVVPVLVILFYYAALSPVVVDLSKQTHVHATCTCIKIFRCCNAFAGMLLFLLIRGWYCSTLDGMHV